MKEKSERVYTDFCQIYENKLIFYSAPADEISHSRNDDSYKRVTSNVKYTGILTKSGKKNIEKRLTAWLFAILSSNVNRVNTKTRRKFYPVFVTLTLPVDITWDDKKTKKKLLEPFIKQLQYNFGVKHYFWKAEKTKIGRLHFHLIFDRYIDKKNIQNSWNSVLKHNNLCDNFFAKFGHWNCPSTKINAIHKSKFPVSYILKYCNKNEKSQKINGLVYRFSNSLLGISNYSNFCFGELSVELDEICAKISNKVIKTDFCRIVYLQHRLDFSTSFLSLRKAMFAYYSILFTELYADSG